MNIIRPRSLIVLAISSACVVASGATVASATSYVASGTNSSITVGGRSFGPSDGLEVDKQSFSITPGGDPVGIVMNGPVDTGGGLAPMTSWGASYAISKETAQLHYTGRAKAAGNVFQGKRIIQVCFWYSRGGSMVGSKKCSNAKFSDTSWKSGPEVSEGVWDSLNPKAPHTIFNIRTARVSPNVN